VSVGVVGELRRRGVYTRRPPGPVVYLMVMTPTSTRESNDYWLLSQLRELLDSGNDVWARKPGGDGVLMSMGCF
jgi:hypothetical protein